MPTNLIATSVTSLNVADLTTTATFYDFTFPDIQLSGSTTYWIVIKAESIVTDPWDTDDYIYVTSGPNAYVDGQQDSNFIVIGNIPLLYPTELTSE